MRVVLDSNVWLAILTSDGACRRMWRKVRQSSTFVVSADILEEVEEKLCTKFGFSARHARLMTFFVRRQSELIPVTSKLTVCRDADDDCILAAALDSQSSHLVTGDADLLALRKFQGIVIATPREFFEMISEK